MQFKTNRCKQWTCNQTSDIRSILMINKNWRNRKYFLTHSHNERRTIKVLVTFYWGRLSRSQLKHKKTISTSPYPHIHILFFIHNFNSLLFLLQSNFNHRWYLKVITKPKSELFENQYKITFLKKFFLRNKHEKLWRGLSTRPLLKAI